ncbi:hypothetical protein [Bifidobacterium platyrrhinorum]|nr:hypothetical protein [Bifidobacterium platyrrhinorum]
MSDITMMDFAEPWLVGADTPMTDAYDPNADAGDKACRRNAYDGAGTD